MTLTTLTNQFLSALSLVVLFTSCEDIPETTVDTSKERAAMLKNMADNIIVPSYQAYLAELEQLKLDVAAISDPSSLDKARQTLKATYVQWQYIALFQFGPADQIGLNQKTNSFPTNQTRIDLKIESEQLPTLSPADVAISGLPALDYLLNSRDAESLLSDLNAKPFLRQYLNQLVQNLFSVTSQTYVEWSPEGANYADLFAESTGSSAGSSLSLVLNGFNKYFESDLRNNKVAIPVGIRSNNVPLPAYTEAYYGGYSSELLRHSVKAVERFYRGIETENSTNGAGLDDYVKAINRSDIHDAVTDRLFTVSAQIEAAPSSLSEYVVNETENSRKIYETLQHLVILFKNDLTSALGVSITYADNDGD